MDNEEKKEPKRSSKVSSSKKPSKKVETSSNLIADRSDSCSDEEETNESAEDQVKIRF